MSRKSHKALSKKIIKRSLKDKQIINKLHKTHVLARQKFGTPLCSKGEIIREGYRRPSVSNKNKSIWVKPTCILSRSGKSSKGKQLFVLSKDTLEPYNYKGVSRLSSSKRQHRLKNALNNGVKPLSLFRRLTALATLNKNINPKLHDIFTEDAQWVKTTKAYHNRNS